MRSHHCDWETKVRALDLERGRNTVMNMSNHGVQHSNTTLQSIPSEQVCEVYTHTSQLEIKTLSSSLPGNQTCATTSNYNFQSAVVKNGQHPLHVRRARETARPILSVRTQSAKRLMRRKMGDVLCVRRNKTTTMLHTLLRNAEIKQWQNICFGIKL